MPVDIKTRRCLPPLLESACETSEVWIDNLSVTNLRRDMIEISNLNQIKYNSGLFAQRLLAPRAKEVSLALSGSTKNFHPPYHKLIPTQLTRDGRIWTG